MAEFLDKDGLAHVWFNLRKRFNGINNAFGNVNISLRNKADIDDVNKIVTYKTAIQLPSGDEIQTLDNISFMINQDGSSFTKSIDPAYYVVPLHASYYYYPSKSGYNSDKKVMGQGVCGISAPFVLSNKTYYNICFKSIGQWKEWTGYFEVECLLVKIPYSGPIVG